MTQHTPGPWFLSNPTRHGNRSWTIQHGADGIVCAEVKNYANAKLIASAPDMLATLRAIAAECEDYLHDDLHMDAVEQCQAFLAAINKVHDQATGFYPVKKAVQPCSRS